MCGGSSQASALQRNPINDVVSIETTLVCCDHECGVVASLQCSTLSWLAWVACTRRQGCVAGAAPAVAAATALVDTGAAGPEKSWRPGPCLGHAVGPAWRARHGVENIRRGASKRY